MVDYSVALYQSEVFAIRINDAFCQGRKHRRFCNGSPKCNKTGQIFQQHDTLIKQNNKKHPLFSVW